MNKRLSDSYLMTMTKQTLIEMLRCAEHNEDAAKATLEQQAENVKDWHPIKHGHWINYKFHNNFKKCSMCKCERESRDSWWGYCPNCGTKMDEEEL